jgi:two-component system, NtrC family, response regulator AtoC
MNSQQSPVRKQGVSEQSEGQKLALEIFTLLEHENRLGETVSRMEGMLKTFSGCDAVSIHLMADEGIPCFVGHNPADPQCICARLVHGQSDLDVPYYSPAGSFWINDRSLLTSSSSASTIACLSADAIESMAIIPLRCGDAVIGLLQLQDPAKGLLPSQRVHDLETVAHAIGIVLARVRTAEEQARAREDLDTRLRERTDELSVAQRRLTNEIDRGTSLEQNLSLSQHRLELAMHAANLGSWDWDVSRDEVLFDRLWSSFAGYTGDEGESVFCTWNNLIHPDDKLRVLRALKSHLENPANHYEAEYRLQAKTGEWRWILDRGKVVEKDSSGKPLRMAGIYLDITDRKLIEEQLHGNEERLRGIFESARDCIFVKDADLRYTHVNPYFSNLLGLQESEIVGHTDEELFGKLPAGILQDADLRVLKGESLEQEHTRTVRGVSATFLDIKVPMRDSVGKVIGIIGISREVTARMRPQPEKRVLEPDYDSPAFRQALRSARMAAETDSVILLTGESGAGKDYVARYIHRQSKRASGPFFFINCAAVAPELAESELFGYEPGAFTGARGTKKGLLELAEGGTILLNEIGELSLMLQAKLLTFLDTRQFTRVGGVKVRSVSARLIAATNRDLAKEVEQKRFRHDLFYRLDVFTIEVPPLRQRVDDIPDLARVILRELAENLGLEPTPTIDPQALKALTAYRWPGNVRELRNVLERALILCDKTRITIEDLNLQSKLHTAEQDADWSFAVGFPEGETLNDVTYNVKRSLVAEALRRSNGARNRAARLLGISIDSLKHYMRVFDLYG